jgi:PAS domain S-box-containing protein
MCLMNGELPAEDPLDQKEEQHDCRLCSMLMNSVPSSVLLLDQQMRIVSANRKFLLKSRLPASLVIGRCLGDVFPPVIYRNMNFGWRVAEVFRTGQAVEGERMLYRAPGLPARTYYYSLVPFRWEERIRNVLLLMEDVTDMIRLGEDARKAERHLASVIESASDIVLSMHPSGKILTWNTAASQITGFEEHKVRDRHLGELCSESQRPMLYSALKTACQPGRIERNEVNLISHDGRVIPIAWVFSAMRDTQKQVVGIVAVGRDLTERHRLETQLRQAEKLAALGVMAGGIAHELRNPLAVISSSAQLLGDKRLPPEAQADCVERIIRGSMRMGGIIENLLHFARPSDEGRKERLDLGTVLRETIASLAEHPETQQTEIEVRVPGFPVAVDGNSCLLQQLITNLIQNAVHAMTDRHGKIHLVLERTDTQAVLLVSDEGRGINPAHLDKVFDPFFTDMPVGKGTGLGLSICHSIVQQHEGSIKIASDEGNGTSVKVLLPLRK